MITVEKSLIEKIQGLKKPAIIAISGFGGAGKSTFAELLGGAIGASVIGLDSFARDRLETHSLWESMDFDRLEREVLIPFLSNTETIQYGHYDWKKKKLIKTNSRGNTGSLSLEGVGLLCPNITKYFS